MAQDTSGAGSGSNYGKVISDGHQTVSLAAAVVDFAGGYWKSYSSKQSAASAYRANLGEWADEAIDRDNQWLQPVLRLKPFEDHLFGCHGRPVPTGECRSRLAWAQLLYALDIRPGAKVLEWRLPPKAIDPSETGSIALIVDGSVMCHIINLYRLYKNPVPVEFTPMKPMQGEPSGCNFSFGRLTVQRLGADRFTASFDPGSRGDLAAKRVPFSHIASYLPGTHLKFERNTLMFKYFDCVLRQVPAVEGASMSPLPPPNAPPQTRVEYYNHSIKMLRNPHQCSDKCVMECFRSSSSHSCGDGCRMMGSWIAGIERIKRRVTTNGGGDHGLLDFIVDTLEKRPQFVSELTKKMRDLKYSAGGDEITEDMRAKNVSEILKERCMFAKDRLVIYWHPNGESKKDPRYYIGKHQIIKELPAVLEELTRERQVGWLAQVATIDPAVFLEMFKQEEEFRNLSVLVLELGSEHDLWKGEWEVKGE
ncbi:hypothetical protein MCOR25_004942 [Pyricularia grisea]|nr:hypothetical protein MCOR25_004942 [Pyricularia grisea]